MEQPPLLMMMESPRFVDEVERDADLTVVDGEAPRITKFSRHYFHR
jgi:hypothetical protein